MSTNPRTRVSRPSPWPARPRPAEASRSDERPRLLSPARWRALAARLGASGDAARTRRSAASTLRALYEGSAVREPEAWRQWMRDGRWVDFWIAYVDMLSPRERRAWRRALSRPARGDRARRMWQVVSARLLGDLA